MYTLIVFLPLLGAILAGFFGRMIGVKLSEYITSGFVLFAAILSWVSLFQIGIGGTTELVTVMPWISSGNFTVDWALRIDTLTAVMLVVVNSVSGLVHVYSIGYMHNDPHRTRFFAYLSLFTFSMLMLVTSNNFLQMFFGWEGVGLASYLLIGFWYKKPSANAAAIKAFVVNRVGDFGFVLGIFMIFAAFGSLDFDTVFAAAAERSGETVSFLGLELDLITTICILLFFGAMGKSAQFLLHTWLPDAMEGPTPVSALIHAATMVTAGVFLVVRCSPLFELSADARFFVTFIGASTAFFAATVGLVQNDIKRVIAYSTCSQLGYMFVAAGLGAYGVAIFHLFTHAFFKALLFLGSGSVIHACSDEQDMRKMGGLARHLKATWVLMLIGTLALTGFPLTAGYFSKDAIIEATFAAGSNIGMYAFVLTVAAAAMTSFYSWRLMFMTFHGKSRASEEVVSHIHESPKMMLVPLVLLATGALAAGYLFSGYFIGHGNSHFWGEAIRLAKENTILDDIHSVPFWVKTAPFVMMILGFTLAWVFYLAKPGLPARLAASMPRLYQFLLNKWYIDELYDAIFVRPAFRIGRFLWKTGDGTIIDGLGPDGIAARVMAITGRAVKMQSGFLYHYAFAMLVGVAFMVTFFLFNGI